ncbi:MAG TPA: calcium/sodium antiporter [Bacteroidales bacterium]|nr:calcium/sodium antiporter [Bacteroidales bacterium]
MASVTKDLNSMLFTYLILIAGFFILIVGANFLVEGAASLGKKLKMSSAIIGFTIVAVGTSLPELIINVFASIEQKTDLAIANVIGSNIMNTLLVIGVAASFFPIIPDRKTLSSFLPLSLMSALLLAFFAGISFSSEASMASINRGEGIILFLLFFGFLMFSWNFSKKEVVQETAKIKELSVIKSVVYIILGIIGLYFGGSWVIEGINQLMMRFGLSEAIVGITIVAVATSLPELVTSIVAALKKNSGIALGNALGSNIVNVFLVLGISAIITPLTYSSHLNLDVTIMAVSNVAVFFFVIVGKGRQITRAEGIIMMMIYFSYITWLIVKG